MSEVVLIKTIIGEEIVSTLVSSTHPTQENSVTLSRPRVFQFQQVDGRMVPALVPWVITDPDNRSVPMANFYIVSMIEAPNELSKAYLAQVSGIQLATK